MRLNKKGSVLLISTLALYLIIVISAAFFLVNANEVNYARQYYHSTAALWLAEAGINMYMANPGMLEGKTSEIDYGNGKIFLSEDDTHPMFRYVRAIGKYGNNKRQLEIAYPAGVPEAFSNSFSTGGGIQIKGTKTYAVINGRTRLTGKVSTKSAMTNVIFDDAEEGVDADMTSLHYASNTSNDSQTNFINNNRALIANYPADQVLYLKNTQAITLTPREVAGKSIVYVEGDSRGGNVTIDTNKLVKPHQTLTVIASGTVTFNQNGIQPPHSQLNIIAWGGYKETVKGTSTHHGLVYTHGVADFSQIRADSVTDGGIIADGGIILNDIWSTKIFNFSDMTSAGVYPPGFEILTGKSTMGVALKPTSWKEIPI